jgi:hypothetical protein
MSSFFIAGFPACIWWAFVGVGFAEVSGSFPFLFIPAAVRGRAFLYQLLQEVSGRNCLFTLFAWVL